MAPMNRTPSQNDIASTLAQLQLSTKDPQKPLYKPKSKPVADSWDDDSDADNSDSANQDASPNPETKKHNNNDDDDDDDDDGSNNSSSNNGARRLNTGSSSTSATATALASPLSTSPHPPPPTPASPTPMDDFPDNTPYGSGAAGPRSRGNSRAAAVVDRRPEKTTAVAGRLIAGALGVRAPRRTEEEREFDRVVREKERRRREEERERERREREEREKRVRAVWEE